MSRQPPLVWVIASSTTCKIIEVILLREGIIVQTFASREKIPHSIQAYPQAPSPALVIVDIRQRSADGSMLRCRDGYKLLRSLKQNPACSSSTFFIFSRRDSLHERLVGRLLRRLAGVAGHIPKPLKEKEVVALVKKRLHLELGHDSSHAHTHSPQV